MMSNKNKNNIYWIATGLLSALILVSAGLDLFYNEMVSEAYIGFGFPTYIIYPLGVVKILGLIAIWYKKANMLKKLAYAGFFFNFLLAFGAHIAVNDLGFIPAIIGVILLGISYMYDKEVISS